MHWYHSMRCIDAFSQLLPLRLCLCFCCVRWQGPKFQEIVNLRLADGEIRRGQVLEIDGDKAVVQVSPLDTPHLSMVSSIVHGCTLFSTISVHCF